MLKSNYAHNIFAVKGHGNSSDVLQHKRILPCGCILKWNEEDVLIAFCIIHSFDYSKWRGKSEEFIRLVTRTQREIRQVDESILAEMR